MSVFEEFGLLLAFLQAMAVLNGPESGPYIFTVHQTPIDTSDSKSLAVPAMFDLEMSKCGVMKHPVSAFDVADSQVTLVPGFNAAGKEKNRS